ncbi:MAG: hypothetical protein WC437_01915 [Patescibacteria group bacterium]
MADDAIDKIKSTLIKGYKIRDDILFEERYKKTRVDKTEEKVLKIHPDSISYNDSIYQPSEAASKIIVGIMNGRKRKRHNKYDFTITLGDVFAQTGKETKLQAKQAIYNVSRRIRKLSIPLGITIRKNHVNIKEK